MSTIYADNGNLYIEYSDQEITFIVDGKPVLVVDATAADLIDMIQHSTKGN